MVTRFPIFRLMAPVCLAATVLVSALHPAAMANPGDVNSINDGQNVTGGTFYNTPGDKTTFINSAGTGLYIHAGTTVIGQEVSNAANPAGSLTGNGGWLHFNAPGQVVRVDGNINVNALMNGGAYIGNGGRVTVDSAYLYQNGQITANGINGGHVQFNVGHLTLGPNAAIYAQGFGGLGGVVQLGNHQTKGVVDIQQGAIVDTTGKVIGNYDANLITIEGGLINLEGILIANGVHATQPSANGGDGGTVTLLAKGGTTALTNTLLNTSNFMGDVKANLVARDASLRTNNYDGWIRLGAQAQITTNGGNGMAGINDDGGNGGDGGYIEMVAKCGIENNGAIQNNGGLGGDAPTTNGTLSVVRACRSSYLEEDAVGKDGGNGGDGGNIDIDYGTVFHNNGSIQSNGGNGGNGGDAIAVNPAAQYSWAFGADGGNGSDGGNISINGSSAPVLNPGSISQVGGIGGLAGHGVSQTPGNASSGDNGTNGDAGIYDYTFTSFCTNGCDSAPGGNPITPPITPGTPSTFLSGDFHGLFQNNRPVFSQPVNPQIPPLMLALGQSKMFLAKTYTSVTQEILTLALREYNRLLAIGRPAGESKQEAQTLLQRSGVDSDVAQALLDRIKNGNLQAGDVVVQMLKDIAATTQTSSLPAHP